MAVSRDVKLQRQKWRERQARYRQRLREKVAELIPEEPCYRCRKYGVDTELAHVKPTGVRGRGRGFGQRLRDVLKNPECFVRMCVPCHRGFDAGKHGLELEEAPF